MLNLSIAELAQRLKAILTLEIIMEPKKWLRLSRFFEEDACYKFSIDDDSGNNLTIILTSDGALIKGFEVKNELNQFEAEEWDPNVIQRFYEEAPKDLYTQLNEDERDETTFCMWYSEDTGVWTQNDMDGNDGGRDRLLGRVFSTPEAWSDWAGNYYHLPLDIEAVRAVYSGQTVTPDMIRSLNPDRDAAEAQQEIEALEFYV